MSTVTSHSLLSRPVRSSAGTSFGCLKPAVVALPFRPAGKRMPRSICYSADPKRTDDPDTISPIALVHPSRLPTSTDDWKITEDDKNVKLTFFHMPDTATTEQLEVVVEDDVLVIRLKKPKPPAEHQGEPAHGDISLDVRLLVPHVYDKDNIQAELNLRALVGTVPKKDKRTINIQKVTIQGK